MSPAISIRNLGKRYRINHSQERTPYRTLRESLARAASAPLRRLRGETSGVSEEFWALSDVSFDICPGEVVGIIGRNGAGKSTLLKILSRITKPAVGEVEINGRVGSLLEVGTGFHPELSGRENIYMNGSILGMSRQEISRKFDDIVSFSEIDRFLDTPVKRYSSGMYVRLAFAVAAHLEPEILVVDEVLAVGDAGFQQKCLGKMGDVARTGRTVLFVSHNMQAISTLCTRAMLMAEGRVAIDGEPRQVVQAYLESGAKDMAQVEWADSVAPGSHIARLVSVSVRDERDRVAFDHDISNPISVEMQFRVLQECGAIDASIHVLNAEGLCLFAVGAAAQPESGVTCIRPGLYRATCQISADLLNDGKHYVSAFVVRDKTDRVAFAHEAVSFMAHDYGTARGGYVGKIIGAVRPLLPWAIERIGEPA